MLHGRRIRSYLPLDSFRYLSEESFEIFLPIFGKKKKKEKEKKTLNLLFYTKLHEI